MPSRDDDEIDDASLSSMRSVWLAMRDEEPPAAGMSALLAAAAAKADEMRTPAPWWQRMFAQLRRPPALAFATVMILIGGAVLVTRETGDEKVASMTAAHAPAVEERPREAEESTRALAPVTAPPVMADGDSKQLDQAPAGPIAIEKPKPAEPKRPVRGTLDKDRAGKHEPNRYERFDDGDDAAFEGKGASKRGVTGTALASPGRGTKSTAPPPPPSPPPPPPPPMKDAAIGASSEAIAADAPAATDTTTVSPSNEQLAKQVEAAAARGDCATVRTIAAKLKQQDARFYQTRLGKNAAVAKCL